MYSFTSWWWWWWLHCHIGLGSLALMDHQGFRAFGLFGNKSANAPFATNSLWLTCTWQCIEYLPEYWQRDSGVLIGTYRLLIIRGGSHNNCPPVSQVRHFSVPALSPLTPLVSAMTPSLMFWVFDKKNFFIFHSQKKV